MLAASRTIGVLILLLGVSVCYGAPPKTGDAKEPPNPTNDELIEILERLQSNDPKQRLAAHAEIVDSFDQFGAKLVQVASETKREEPLGFSSRYLAVELLGRLRVPEGMQLLIENVDRHEFMELGGTAYTPFNQFPYAKALSAYGKLAVYPILRHVEHSPADSLSDKAMYLYARILISAYRPDEGRHLEAIAVADRALARARSKENVKRLRDLMEQITRDWDPPAGAPRN